MISHRTAHFGAVNKDPTRYFASAYVADFDAQSAGSLTISGSLVTTWTSTNGTFAPTQAATNNKPTYSSTGWNGRLPCVTFDGAAASGDFVSLASGGPLGDYWTFIVAERGMQNDDAAGDFRAIMTTSNAAGQRLQLYALRPSADSGSSNLGVSGTGAGATGVAQPLFRPGKAVIFADATRPTVGVAANGSAITFGGVYVNTSSVFTIGGNGGTANSKFAGKIAQVVIIDPSKLPARGNNDEYQTFTNYYMNRWQVKAG